MRAVTDREALPNRRGNETIKIECNGMRYDTTVSAFVDGRIAEIFLSSTKTGSDADTNARDAAIVTSIALQYGVPLDVIRHALSRDAQGRPTGVLGVALDAVVGTK